MDCIGRFLPKIHSFYETLLPYVRPIKKNSFKNAIDFKCFVFLNEATANYFECQRIQKIKKT